MRFLHRQFQTEFFETVFQLEAETLCFALVLEAGKEIVGKAKVIRFTLTLPAHTFAEPKQELYDLEADPFEQNNLLVSGIDVSVILAELQAQADLIRQ